MPQRSKFYGIVLAALSVCPCFVSAADSDTLVGIHFWGDRNDPAPASLLDSQNRGGYDLEIVNTGNPEWNDVDVVDPLYRLFKNSYKVTPITRLGYYWGRTLPAPGSSEYTNWPGYVAANVVNRLKDTAHIWQMGNEPNLRGEAQNWANQQIPPSEYARLYQDVRTAIRSAGVTGTAGPHQLLVAPVSPGGVAGDRYMAGTDWLDQTLASIPTASVDGIALHSYGGGATARASFQLFRKGLIDQIAIVDNRLLGHVPLYLTEWNRITQFGNLADEAISAEFARRSLRWIDRWNRTPGNHNIVASNWFVYDGGNGTGAWDAYSIEYWKNNGNPSNSAASLYNAFYTSARAGYKAGLAGTRPLPGSVRIIDDFEINDGHFAGATPAPPSAGGSATTTGTRASGSFKVRQNDADSYTRFWAHKIGISDDPANPNGWSVRYLSGGGTPANNNAISLSSGVDGNIGFFLRVFSANGSEDLSSAGLLTTQIVLDSGPTGGGINSDAGVVRNILSDGEWHFYEWSLDNPNDWTLWSPAPGSDGKLGPNGDFASGSVSIDSIMFHGGNVNVEYLLDTIMHNSAGTIGVMAGVPEPATFILLGPVVGWLLIRRPQKPFS